MLIWKFKFNKPDTSVVAPKEAKKPTKSAAKEPAKEAVALPDADPAKAVKK